MDGRPPHDLNSPVLRRLRRLAQTARFDATADQHVDLVRLEGVELVQSIGGRADRLLDGVHRDGAVVVDPPRSLRTVVDPLRDEGIDAARAGPPQTSVDQVQL